MLVRLDSGGPFSLNKLNCGEVLADLIAACGRLLYSENSGRLTICGIVGMYGIE